MAILQISRIQHRRGLQQDLPQLASAELGWSIDQRRLYIGNGTVEEGAPTEGVTELLTEHSDLFSFLGFYTFKGLSAGFTVETGPDPLHPVVRTLQDKLDDYVSVKDFGAKGDGFTDDTAAIQRAIDRVYAGNQLTLLENKHRTINFPAGTYIISDTLNLPPYSRLQGEGKNTTVITSTMAKPLMRLVDEFYQYGTSFGQANPVTSATPTAAEYHISDMKFHHQRPQGDQSCFVIDGCYGTYFNRVQFRGMAHTTTPDLAVYGGTAAYDVDKGTGVAGVSCNNLSFYEPAENIVFSQCDFIDHNYGIELNNTTIGVSITGSYFNHLYYGVTTGKDSAGQQTAGVAMFDNYFHYTAAEAVYCGTDSRSFVSQANYFDRSGLADYEADAPVINPTGHAQTPVISFFSDNNFSVGDTFQRVVTGDLSFPYVETNNYTSYIFGQDRGLVNGKITSSPGLVVSLPTSGTYVSAALLQIPSSYVDLNVRYRITSATGECSGTLQATGFGGAYNYSDECVESGSSGVSLRANPTTGDIEYTSTSNATLTYSLNFFTN